MVRLFFVMAFVVLSIPGFCQSVSSSTSTTYKISSPRHTNNLGGMRGDLSYGIQVLYNPAKHETYVGLSATEEYQGTTLFKFSHSTKELSESKFLPTIGTYDFHYLPGWFYLGGGEVLLHRQEYHNDPVRSWTGSDVDNLVNHGLSSDSMAYVTVFQLEDSLYWYSRGRAVPLSDITNLIHKSKDNGLSFSLHHRLIEFEPVDNVAPYPGVYQDFYDQSVVYFAPNKRRYPVNINFFDLALIKSSDCINFENIEGTYSTTSSIGYSELDSFSIRSSSDTINYYLKFCGGFVDEQDEVHFTFLDTETGSFHFARTNSGVFTEKEIPGISLRKTPNENFVPILNDYTELIHKGGDAYDLIVFQRDRKGIFKYSTSDAFDTVSSGERITPDWFYPTVYRGVSNYIVESGRPYTIFARGERAGAGGIPVLWVYEYYPN
jgi:hypothetical protein